MNKIKFLAVLISILLLIGKNAEAQGGGGGGPPPPPPPPKTVPIDGLSGLMALLGAGYLIRRFKKDKEQ